MKALSKERQDEILYMLSVIYDNVIEFKGKARKEQLLVEFKSYLTNCGSGIMENVCHNCLGSGYNNDDEI